MNIETVRRVLLWCKLINYGILLIWFFVFVLSHDGMYQLHGRWFDLSVDQFDMLHYSGMSIYKIGILPEHSPLHCPAHNQPPKLTL
jgi:hypothetical protein